MNKFSSLYLDILRIFAAFGVLLHHCNVGWFSEDKFLAPHYGHKFVILFFVLSGYLIAYSSLQKKKAWEDYLVDRISRLYSVIIPAIALTYFLDGLGQWLNPEFYSLMAIKNYPFLRGIMTLANLHQIQGFCMNPSANTPFWSIGYEFWYYVLFGIFIFVKSFKWKISLLAATSLLIGYKILLLMPIWLLGVVVYQYSKKINIGSSHAIIGGILSFFAMIYLTITPTTLAFPVLQLGHHQFVLYYSQYFLTDYVYGLLFSYHLFCILQIPVKPFSIGFLEGIIKYLASITFSIYLFHYPFIILSAALIPYNHSSYVQMILLLVWIVAVIAVLSHFTESQRGKLKGWLKLLIHSFKAPVILNEFERNKQDQNLKEISTAVTPAS